MEAKVSEQGRVTIPKRLRDELGIAPGEILDFESERGRLIAVKRVVSDPLAEASGSLVLPAPTDTLMEELRPS